MPLPNFNAYLQDFFGLSYYLFTRSFIRARLKEQCSFKNHKEVRPIINNLYLSCLRETLPLATLIVAPDSTFIITLSSLMLSIAP